MDKALAGTFNKTEDLARECVLRFLATTLADPHAPDWGQSLDEANRHVAVTAADLLRRQARGRVPIEPARGELSPKHLNLHALLDELARPVVELREEFNRVFGLVTPRQCPPYETEYHRNEPFFRSQQLADIAGFYRAFGLTTSSVRPERPDHISLQLEFLAYLLMKRRLALQDMHGAAAQHHTRPTTCHVDNLEQARVCSDAYQTFFADHVAWWTPAFATGLARKAQTGFYASLARALAAFVAMERARLGIPGPVEPTEPQLIERPEEQSGCAACPLQS